MYIYDVQCSVVVMLWPMPTTTTTGQEVGNNLMASCEWAIAIT